MNKNGTRIYDKRGEALDEDGKDIGYDCTRIETRVTLNKSIPIEQAEAISLVTNYPTMTIMDVEFTRWSLGIEIDHYIWSCLQSINRGESILEDYKSRPRDYKKIKALINELKTKRVSLSPDDVRMAFIRFKIDYQTAYYNKYKPLSLLDNADICIRNF